MCSQSDANRLQRLVWILILSRHKTPMKKQRTLLPSLPNQYRSQGPLSTKEERGPGNEVANLVSRAFSALLSQDDSNGASERKNAKKHARTLRERWAPNGSKMAAIFNFLIFNNLLCYRRYPGK